MASRSSHNKNNAGVKRILQEARELATDPSNDYHAAPLEDDIFEWHCTMRGPAGTEFEGGIYHFRIQLPSEYPFRPPSIMLLTPNGRFELNKKICISFTNYHEELWQPAWGVRTAIVALQGFFPFKGQAAAGVGAVEYPIQERQRLAKLSRDWRCLRCEKTNYELLPDVTPCVQTTVSFDHTRDMSNGGRSSHAVTVDASDKAACSNGSPTTPPLSLASQTTAHSETQVILPPTIGLSPQPPTIQRHPEIQRVHSRSPRPPLVLDGAIAVCLTMLVAILWKKIF